MKKLSKIAGIFDRRKKDGELTPEEIEKNAASRHRREGNLILDELDEALIILNRLQAAGADGPDGGGTFEERLAAWKKAVSECAKLIEHAPSSNQNTEELDRNIRELVIQFRVALDHRDEQAANQICKFIGKSITELRRDAEGTTDEAVESERKERADQAEMMVVLADHHNRLHKLRATVENYNKQLKERKPEMEKAFTEVKEMQAKYPELQYAVEEGLVEKKKIDGIAFEINTVKARAVAIKDEVEELILLRAQANANIQSIETMIHTVEQMLLNAAGKIPTELSERVDELTSRFQAQLIANDKALNELAEANKRFRYMIDSFFSSSQVLDRMIENEMRFAEMEREMQQKEELRQAGLKRKHEEEQKLAMEQEAENEYVQTDGQTMTVQ